VCIPELIHIVNFLLFYHVPLLNNLLRAVHFDFILCDLVVSLLVLSCEAPLLQLSLLSPVRVTDHWMALLVRCLVFVFKLSDQGLIVISLVVIFCVYLVIVVIIVRFLKIKCEILIPVAVITIGSLDWCET
jgi:hypothetical protein